MAKGAGSRVIGTQRCFLLSSDLCGKHLHGKGRRLKSHWNSTLLSPFIRSLWKTPPWQRAQAQESLELNAAFSFHPIFVENTSMAKGAGSRVIGTQRCFLLSSDLCGKHLHGKGRRLKSHWNSTLLSPFIRSLWKTPPWQRAQAQESLELNAAFSFHPIFVENTSMAKGASSRVIGTQRCFLLSSDLCGKHHHGKGRSNEKGSSKQGHDQGLHCRLSRKQCLTEKECDHQSPELIGRAWSSRSEEDRHLHYPRTRQDQDTQKASHKGRQEDDVRQGSCRESQASQDCRQGICSGRTQSSDLMTLCSPYSPVKDCVGKATTIFTVFLLRLSFVDMAANATVHVILSQPLSKRDKKK